jgi:glucokinase
MYAVCSNSDSVVGLDVGGTKIACMLGFADGSTKDRTEVPTEARRPFAETFPVVVELVQDRLDSAHALGREVLALSIAIGGPLRRDDGVLLDPPHLPGWHQVNLKRALSEAFPHLPVYFEHDGVAGALAELRFGVGRSHPNLKHLIFLTFGTGLGAGIIVNGQILRGATETAGEVGHWRLSESGPPCNRKKGCWESYASGAGLVQLAAMRFPHRWRAHTSIRDLIDAMLANDHDALHVAHEAGEWLGRGMALLIDAFNPQVIVLGSLGFALGERVLGPARRIVAQEALPQAATACEIVPSPLGSRLGDVASLMAALSHPDFQKTAPPL